LHVALPMAPVAVDHVPGEQLVQAVLDKAETYVPARQGWQDTAPEALVKRPLAHWEHVLRPWAL